MNSKPELGLGIMRFQSQDEIVNYDKVKSTIDEYMKGEFCYFDVHPAYVLGKAQQILREYVVDRYPRERFFIANKIPYYGIHQFKDYENVFEDELKECNVDYFDYYMLHAVTKDVYKLHEKYGGFEFLKREKAKGKIKNIGISFHDSPELLEEILKKHIEIDFVQLQINFLDWDNPIIRSRECYEIARKFNKVIIVMEPIKGGSLANELVIHGKKISASALARLSLQFVAKLPGIFVILSGMTNKNQVLENRKTLIHNQPIDLDIYKELIEKIKSQNRIACTSCGYCKRECPMSIEIPNIINLLNMYKTLSKGKVSFLGGSRSIYRSVIYEKGKAGDCISCGKCEQHCPQKIKISEQMKEAKKMFESDTMNYYTTERNTQILIYLMKAYGIKKIVISPGTTNVCFAQSVQYDGFFEIYSAADERSAAYISCGLAEESGEPVALSCTGATASRNYIPALTEGFYRKLPIIAITSSQPRGRIGHNIPQMIDRTRTLGDIVKLSVELPIIKDAEDEWACTIDANKALIEATGETKGPVHINLVTGFSADFSVKQLPAARVIRKHKTIKGVEEFKNRKICIFCGAHSRWSKKQIAAVDQFCQKYGAIVLQDHTGNYHGKYGIKTSVIFTQEKDNKLNDFDLLIHIGNISGAYYPLTPRQVWRVNPDGEICDTFRALTDVFEMEEEAFFEDFAYLQSENIFDDNNHPIGRWRDEEERLLNKVPDLPFSNLWVAKYTSKMLPEESVIHFGILNSLRSWNMFRLPDSVYAYANTGGFGIDGCVSSLIGASLSNSEKLYFGVVGDLAFFYDMNSIGNRHVGKNLRLLVVNNGCGTEFMNYNHMASVLGEEKRKIVAAEGHYGSKSSNLLCNYAKSLGFRYLSAHNKKEFEVAVKDFVDSKNRDKSIVFEIFTDSIDESDALRIMNTLDGNKTGNERLIKSDLPKRIIDTEPIGEVVLWGTGGCFKKNISKIKQIINVKYVCDNNKEKWGYEVEPGIICISPEEILKLNSPFVIIMIESAQIGFQIANQLLDMGISQFDIYSNWLTYLDEFKEVLS